MKTVWKEKRLAKLFDRYNRLYWHGKLPKYTVRIGKPPAGERWVGLCDVQPKIITIDIEQHHSDREIRATLLHEMAHAAAPPKRHAFAHGYAFASQMEGLLRRKAPVTVSDPETGGLTILVDVVPKRFPLMRARMNRAEAVRVRTLQKWAEKRKPTFSTITPAVIVRQFENICYESTWKEALAQIGTENGLIDVEGRPRDRRAARILAKAKRVFDRARRDYLECEKLSKLRLNFLPDWSKKHRRQTTSFDRLYTDYREWCQGEGSKPLGLHAFRESVSLLTKP